MKMSTRNIQKHKVLEYKNQETKLSMEEFNFGTQNSCVESNSLHSICSSEASINSSSCRNFLSVDYRTSNSDNSSQQSNWTNVWPDYQLQNMCGSIDGSGSIWMNDISLGSLLKEDFPDMLYQQEDAFSAPDLQWSSISQPDLLTDWIVHSEEILNSSSSIGGLTHIKESGIFFATGNTSNDRDIEEIWQPFTFQPITSERTDGLPNAKAQSLAWLNSSVNNKSDGVVREKSLEAAVLQELVDIMQQMNQSTRIGFRDAFYNLAQHAAVLGSSTTNRPSSVVVSDEQPLVIVKILRREHSQVPNQQALSITSDYFLGIICRFGEMLLQELDTARINKTMINPTFTKPNNGIQGIAWGALMDKGALETTNSDCGLMQHMDIHSLWANKIKQTAKSVDCTSQPMYEYSSYQNIFHI